MKKFLAILAGVLMSAALMVSASAAEPNEILKGTPQLDGQLDDIYLSSAKYTITEDHLGFAWGGALLQPYDGAASYFLWDDDYLYICTVNKDDTPVSLALEPKTWQNDAADMWFGDEGLRYKIHGAADGTFNVGDDGDGYAPYDFEGAQIASAFTEDGWCVEVALPINDRVAGREINYGLQVTNILDDQGVEGSTSGKQFGDVLLTLSAEAVALPGAEATDAVAANEILKGTPQLDGQLDDNYLLSAKYTITEDHLGFAWGGALLQPYDGAASYFLWDDDYLYICTVNKDDTPVSLALEPKTWQNDAADMWFGDEGLRYKIHGAADGTFHVGDDGDGYAPYDFEGAQIASAFTEDGWCVEVALPINDRVAGREINYGLQVTNILDDQGVEGSTSGKQFGDVLLTLSAVTVPGAEPVVETPVVEEPVVETPVVEEPVVETPVVEEPVVEAPVEVVETPAAPQTFDFGVVAAIAAVVSAAGYALSKKR